MEGTPALAAMSRASVVFPVPGGPQKTSDERRRPSRSSVSAPPGTYSWPRPSTSSQVLGRMRSASGARAAASRRDTGRSNRSPTGEALRRVASAPASRARRVKLEPQAARARAVELAEIHRLPPPQLELRVAHEQGERVPDQHRLDVRRGVVLFVAVAAAPGHETIER